MIGLTLGQQSWLRLLNIEHHQVMTGGGFQSAFEDDGGKVVKKLWSPFNTPDYLPYLVQINPKEGDVGVLVYAGANPIKFGQSVNGESRALRRRAAFATTTPPPIRSASLQNRAPHAMPAGRGAG